MQGAELPEALMIVNDLMAIGAILTFQEGGYRVPQDVAIVGFDDIPEATIVRPTLTTIAQDPRDIGLKLATALFERIENPDLNERRVFESSFELVPRQSTEYLKERSRTGSAYSTSTIFSGQAVMRRHTLRMDIPARCRFHERLKHVDEYPPARCKFELNLRSCGFF